MSVFFSIIFCLNLATLPLFPDAKKHRFLKWKETDMSVFYLFSCLNLETLQLFPRGSRDRYIIILFQLGNGMRIILRRLNRTPYLFPWWIRTLPRVFNIHKTDKDQEPVHWSSWYRGTKKEDVPTAHLQPYLFVNYTSLKKYCKDSLLTLTYKILSTNDRKKSTNDRSKL